MSLRTNLLAKKDRIRDRVLSPNGKDMTPFQLTIITRTWSGGARGLPLNSTPADVPLVLPQRYKVRQLTMRELHASGGRYTAGDIIVEYITPFDGVSSGYTSAQLDPRANKTKGVEFVYRITSTTNADALVGDYTLLEAKMSKSLSYSLVLTARRLFS